MRVSSAFTYPDGSCIEVTVDDAQDETYHPVRMSELVGHARDLIRNVVHDAAVERAEHDRPADPS